MNVSVEDVPQTKYLWQWDGVTENVINEYGRSTFIFDGNSNYYIVKYCKIKH